MLDLLLYILGLIKDLEPTVLYDDDKIAIVQELEPYEDTEDMEVALNLLNYYCYKKDVDFDQNRHVITASIISNNDLDFIGTLEGENDTWDSQRQSDYINQYGYREDSWGFCQVHRPSHSHIVNDPRFFTDEVWQLKECWRLYQDGVAMYGKDKLYKTKQRFQCPNK